MNYFLLSYVIFLCICEIYTLILRLKNIYFTVFEERDKVTFRTVQQKSESTLKRRDKKTKHCIVSRGHSAVIVCEDSTPLVVNIDKEAGKVYKNTKKSQSGITSITLPISDDNNNRNSCALSCSTMLGTGCSPTFAHSDFVEGTGRDTSLNSEDSLSPPQSDYSSSGCESPGSIAVESLSTAPTATAPIPATERDEFKVHRRPKGRAKFIGQSAAEKQKALQMIQQMRSGAGGTLPQDALECHICSPPRPFTAPSTLLSHYRSHAGICPFVCNICSAQFTRQHSLNYHLLIHNNETRFTCDTCGRKFRHPSHFKEHLRRHTGESPYECYICLAK